MGDDAGCGSGDLGEGDVEVALGAVPRVVHAELAGGHRLGVEGAQQVDLGGVGLVAGAVAQDPVVDVVGGQDEVVLVEVAGPNRRARWARKPVSRMPCRTRAATARRSIGLPRSSAEVPRLSIRTRPSSPASSKAWRRTNSAIGDRQMLPQQTTVIRNSGGCTPPSCQGRRRAARWVVPRWRRRCCGRPVRPRRRRSRDGIPDPLLGGPKTGLRCGS